MLVIDKKEKKKEKKPTKYGTLRDTAHYSFFARGNTTDLGLIAF